tara:strand:- start:24 stop:1112 length:1089 start_codon:yes stop_codon:yes gene_type:complete
MKNFFDLIRYLILKKNKKKFTIYSESIFYKNFYLSLAVELNKTNQLCIVTSDYKEYVELKKNFRTFFIGNGLSKIFFFNLLNCEFLILTLTNIGNNYFKSKFCKNYVYFFHSLASTHYIYDKNAFDNYDIIFVNGKYQSDEIRKKEKLNSLTHKKIVPTGYFYLDYLKNKKKDLKLQNQILLAPSWNKSNKDLFNDLAEDIIQFLLKKEFKVIFRPHPESIKRNNKKFKIILENFSSNSKFILDTTSDNSYLSSSSLLITDTSTIAMEFALAFQRPIVYFNYEKKIHNKDHKSLDIEPLEEIFRNQFGINIQSLEELSSKLNNISNLDINHNYSQDLINFEKKYLYNHMDSIALAAKYLNKH